MLHLYLQALQLRDPGSLWALLRQPPTRAFGGGSAVVAAAASGRPALGCEIMQAGGELGLVLRLDGVTLCVLPLGVSTVQPADCALA